MKKFQSQPNPILTNMRSELLDAPFKTVFKATLGFYAAQALITLVGLSAFALVVAIIIALF